MDFNSFSYVNRTVWNHWLFWLSSSDYIETDINLQIAIGATIKVLLLIMQ